ncbi:MAG TPA: carboxypeptidase-like regulatory domain-containing protein [Pyrinomonadaceae bacterium]|nr:carboxypeptidase-like regulatory domain-containing protein [Pyrinomonadaceae bacterium]
MTSYSKLSASLLMLVMLSLVLGAAGQDRSATQTPYVTTGKEATIIGSVRFDGKAPKPLIIDMAADPVCVEINQNPLTDWYVVSEGKVANVIVYVTSDGLAKYSFDSPSEALTLTHINCQFQPHVTGLRVGQSLHIVNADNTQHSTHPTPKYNPEWNQTQPASAPPIAKTFLKPEVAFPIKDNQHPWEKAFVGVFTHPFFAVTGPDGSFRIEGLPPGAYRVHAWHEFMGEKTIDLVLVPGEARHLEFAFKTADVKDKERYDW